MNNYSPLRYPGGKNKTYDYLKYLVEKNNIQTYIEPYCGGAAVALKLLINNDVKKIMINDFDRSIYAFWYSILNYTDSFIEEVEKAVFSIEEWEKQKTIQRNKQTTDLLSLGFSTFYLNRTNRSGIISAGPIGGKNQNGNYKMDCRFNKNSLINKIKLIASNKSKIKLYNLDAIDFIKKNIVRTKNSLIFFDPPYFVKGKDLYTNFYELPDHQELKKNIEKYLNNHKWILTYDTHDSIQNIYSSFEYYTYQLNYSAGSSKKGLEYIFFSHTLSSSDIEKYLYVRKTE
ncbi:DNA adenine methylase [Marinilactibacillus psychrotolerans]|uniref:site-specific DNA-methyltransferase (adenine-specific) n=1 Tax=Marinilactibacillus psychrotolerans TaxID=191770 RepID=A0AAV3WU69_9LACT|nr:DNA adenine methylase [Marinilactibacillus psychrotolerans]GEL66587.1 methylase [Marinilactibacillus psychrotolerans]GEQ35109.1 DNA methyltransferase [Marinilactibacillus psychrotolerans]SDC81914.1 DNA adenine methylase [Marinilactibacillus psychrotolerans]